MLFLFNDWKITYAFSYREDNKKLNKTSLFSYDKGGNIIERIEYAYSTLPVDKLTDGTTFDYDYPISGWKDQLMSYDGESFDYDELGNPTTYRDKALTWKYGRQLAMFDSASYNYNADGIRISKTYNNVTTHFYLDGTKILAQDNGNLLTFKYGVDGVIGFTYNGVGEYFYKKNIFGDIIGIFDSNGQEIVKYVYDAWGNHKTYVLNDGQYVDISTNLSYTQSGSNNKLIAELNPFRYRGYYYDIETGLYYLNSRYYDPEIGRFINADDVSMLDSTQNFSNGLNLYVYCLNNPINDIDSNGNLSWWQWLLFGIGAALVVAAAVVLTVASGGAFAGVAGAVLVGAAKGALIGAAIGTVAGGIIGGATSGWSLNGILTGMAIGFGTGAVIGAITGAFVGGVNYSSLIGKSYEGIGTLTKNPKLTWSSSRIHAGSRMLERKVNAKMVYSTLKNATVFQQTVDKFIFIGTKATIVMTKAGELITLWSKSDNGKIIIEAIKKILGV